MSIGYAQCWEDSDLLRRALSIKPGERVLSIASGGDNSLALLLDNPRSVTALDRNPEQIHLTNLKIAAMRRLEYDDFVQFVAAVPCQKRERIYRLVAPLLNPEARQYWNSHLDMVTRGIIHAGRFERYLRLFRTFVLPLVRSRESLSRILEAASLDEQARLYQKISDNLWWRLLFSVFFSRAVLGRLGRCDGAFTHVTQSEISAELFARTRRGLTEIPSRDNYLLWYILSGRFNLPESGPDYLLPKKYYLIRERLERLHLVIGDLGEHLTRTAPGTYSAYNLSDVFEYLNSAQLNALAKLLCDSATEDARAAFWTMFTRPQIPHEMIDRVKDNCDVTKFLASEDRGFFYGSFNTWRIKGAARPSGLESAPCGKETNYE